MTNRKDQELKDFLINARKKNSSKLSDAPIWVIQKAGKRFYNPRQHRNWRETHLGLKYHNMIRSRKKNKKMD